MKEGGPSLVLRIRPRRVPPCCLLVWLLGLWFEGYMDHNSDRPAFQIHINKEDVI